MNLKIFKGLERFGSHYPSKAVKYAMENREEATPELLEILEYTLSDVKRLSKDEDYLIQFPAIYMLACFREKRAFDGIVRIASLPDEQAYDLLGDTITEDFGRILASVCDGNMEPIKGIIENSSLDEYVRSQALDSLLVLLNNGMVSREQLVFYFKELLNGKLEVDYSYVWDSLPRICSLIHPKGLEEDIRKAVKDGKIMREVAGFDFMERQLQRPVGDVLEELKEDESYSLISGEDVSSLEKWVGVKKSGDDFEEDDEYVTDFEKESTDKNAETLLLEVLESVKTYGQRLHENRIRRLWKEVDIPCSLHDAIHRLSKTEMDAIRKNYDLRNVSTLKKPELEAELARQIPSIFPETIYALDKGAYDDIKLIAKNSGVIPDTDIPFSDVEKLLQYCMAFPGVYREKKVVFMPAELTNIFIQADGSEMESIVRRNTEWVF